MITLRYLWVYSAADEWTVAWHERQLARRVSRGIDIKYYCNTPLSLQRRWLHFAELDRRWKIGDYALLQMYEGLVKELEGRDVIILYNGANLHPEFVDSLKHVMKIYTAADTESAAFLSKPIAPAFDVHLVNHLCDVERFRKWGLKHVYFWPLGSLASEDVTSDVTEESILDVTRRTTPTVLFCAYTHWRKKQLDALVGAFPDAHVAGAGWPRGLVDYSEMWETYRHAQIGWNIHNSTGFNFRTFELPAYGVMQVCDNKSELPAIFEVGKEVIGFDSIEECIDLTRYYLAHPLEQRQIALNGWRRWKREYTPDRVWDKLVTIVEKHWPDFAPDRAFTHADVSIVLRSVSEHRRSTVFIRILHRSFRLAKYFARPVWRALKGLLGKAHVGD